MISRGKRRYLRMLTCQQLSLQNLRAAYAQTLKPGWEPSPQMKKTLAILDPTGRITGHKP